MKTSFDTIHYNDSLENISFNNYDLKANENIYRYTN